MSHEVDCRLCPVRHPIRRVGRALQDGPRGRSSPGACVLLAGVLLAGCYSYESRWGRDPAELKKAPAHRSRSEIEIAKSAAMKEEQQPAPTDLSPVSVLFVNGEPLTVEDILKWIRYDLEEMAQSLAPAEYRKKLIEIVRAEVRSRAESQLLSQVALRRLTEQEIERLDRFVDERIREIVNTRHSGRQTRYEQWLRERGLTVADDRSRIRREMLVIAYLQRTVAGKVAEPTRREIEQFYDDYVRDVQADQKRRMLLIDIPLGSSDVTGRILSVPVPADDARRRAAAALEKLRAGDDFTAVARSCSEGINAGAGGDWGWITREGVRPRWQPAVDALYQLEEGQTSDPIETGEAIFIVKCAAIERREVKDFEQMQRELVGAYKNRQFDILSRELIAELYEQANVRPTNPARFLRAVLEAAPRSVPAGR